MNQSNLARLYPNEIAGFTKIRSAGCQPQCFFRGLHELGQVPGTFDQERRGRADVGVGLMEPSWTLPCLGGGVDPSVLYVEPTAKSAVPSVAVVLQMQR